jgi:NADH-quinone oxidoreductase subunit I
MSLLSFLRRFPPLDLFEGLAITGAFLFKKKATIEYPEKRPVPAARFRGMFGYSEERCIGCLACARACPIGIIFIETHPEETEVDGKKKRKIVVDRYDIDLKRCMFCGICEESCPTKPTSIWLTTKTYELASFTRNESLYFDKRRLQSWEGVLPYPGVVSPDNGQMPDDPTGSNRKAGGV